jgi:hypothetical protein
MIYIMSGIDDNNITSPGTRRMCNISEKDNATWHVNGYERLPKCAPVKIYVGLWQYIWGLRINIHIQSVLLK